MSNYIQYKDTNYIILSDGRAARLLKPTKAKSGNQEYVNFIIGGKQERVNANMLKELYASSTATSK